MEKDLGRPVQPSVLRSGSSPVLWKENQDPLTSFMTRVAFAAFTCGFDLISDKGFHHSVADDAADEDEIAASRSVTWIWDEKTKATFTPIPAEETITLQEFETRFSSLKWVHENPDHPIAYMRMFLEKSREGFEKIRAIRPTRRITRGDAVATVPHDATQEQIDELFDELNE